MRDVRPAPVATADGTPHVIQAPVFRGQVVIRRGPLGQALAAVLRADNAPVQGTDRFVLEASNACLVDDVNIGDGVSLCLRTLIREERLDLLNVGDYSKRSTLRTNEYGMKVQYNARFQIL
ncbi:MAG: hypothetical protein KF886_00400 [Candidatus Hydrogenedentes bacterium]|nr:hypothetical protein [Candidatus Hydrogenedentota bacterium]